MSDGVLADDAIVWAGVRAGERLARAELGSWMGVTWLSGSCVRPWRARITSGEFVSRARSYRTEEAAQLATGARLRKAVTR